MSLKTGTSSPADKILLVSWLVIVLSLAAMILFGLPEWFSALRQVCTGADAECMSLMQLTPDQAVTWQSIDFYAWYNVITRGAARLFSFILGVLIFLKKPNRMTWVTSIFLIVGIENGIGAALASAHPSWFIPVQILSVIGAVSLVMFALLFPNNQFAPYWTCWIILPWALISVADFSISHNSTMGRLLGITSLFLILLIVGIVVYRYRQVFGFVDRQKVKWVVYAFTVGFSLFVSGIAITIAIYGFESPVLSPGIWILQDFLIIGVGDYLIPAAIAISIFRYQLFDIDVIIRKTLLYGSLTVLLGLVFFGLVTVLQGIFSSLTKQQSPVSIVISTLAIAALFNPVWRLLQKFIDQHFYRSKYDAEQALAGFAKTAREEVDVGRISARLVAITQTTLQPESTSLWLRPARRNNTNALEKR